MHTCKPRSFWSNFTFRRKRIASMDLFFLAKLKTCNRSACVPVVTDIYSLPTGMYGATIVWDEMERKRCRLEY